MACGRGSGRTTKVIQLPDVKLAKEPMLNVVNPNRTSDEARFNGNTPNPSMGKGIEMTSLIPAEEGIGTTVHADSLMEQWQTVQDFQTKIQLVDRRQSLGRTVRSLGNVNDTQLGNQNPKGRDKKTWNTLFIETRWHQKNGKDLICKAASRNGCYYTTSQLCQSDGYTREEGGEELKQPEPQSTKDNGNAQVPTPVGLKEEWTTVKGKSATKSVGLMPIRPIEAINGYQQLEEDTVNQMIQAVMKMLDRGTCSTSGVVKAPDLPNIAK
ncbi:hypothetical protein RDI58_011195 [Solanum bulbocastanum]|uniref:Uncharacterized protein n=1 Tax=Solanum bulbocastanum TaxID=147425 RepID=A0AAN8YG19_SOLBU